MKMIKGSTLFWWLTASTMVWAQQQGEGEETTCSCAPSASEPVPILDTVIERCDPNNVTYCALYCGEAVSHRPETTLSYLSDKCCVHAGKSASLLAFEADDKWAVRLQEFNKCTGAKVRIEYLPEGEDGMAEALKRDVGQDESYGESDHNENVFSGEGIFDAYIVQAPWYV